jgi:hypothetical protein
MRAAFLAAALASISSIDFAAAQQLANGKYFQAGNIGDATWRWQASGVLSVGRCPFSLGWSTCYISFVLLYFLLSCLIVRLIAFSTCSSLGATGNLQETTQADYLASLNGGLAAAAPTTAPNGIKYTTLAGKQASAEERALLDDEDLDAYFEAFPEQEPDRYSSALTSSSTSFKVRSPACSHKLFIAVLTLSVSQAKRQGPLFASSFFLPPLPDPFLPPPFFRHILPLPLASLL